VDTIILIFLILSFILFSNTVFFPKQTPHEVQKIEITVNDDNVTHEIEENNGTTETQELPLETNATSALIEYATDKLGTPYKLAHAGPDFYDCSGFVYDVYKNTGITLPRTAIAQSEFGEKIEKAELQAGDLIFFDTSDKGEVNHSGIYIGDAKFIHASSGKNSMKVVITELNNPFYIKAYRDARRVDLQK
jgi:cell wall-associated NlpC family hydrolase